MLGTVPAVGCGISAEAMAIAHFRCVESLLDGAQIADRNVGLLHLRHPVLEPIAGKHAGNDRAQFFLVGRAVLPVGEIRIGNEVGPIQHFRDKAAIQPIVGAGHVERSVGGLVDADRGRAVRRIPETARILAADQIRHAVETRSSPPRCRSARPRHAGRGRAGRGRSAPAGSRCRPTFPSPCRRSAARSAPARRPESRSAT